MLSIISAQLARGSRVRRRGSPEVVPSGRAAIRRTGLSGRNGASNVGVGIAIAVVWNEPPGTRGKSSPTAEDVAKRDDHNRVASR
jgi:hypothetical protein